MPVHPPDHPKTVSFEERKACPTCNSESVRRVWAGCYSDPAIRSFLAEFHYAVDVETLLGNHDFELVQCRDCDLMFHQRILTPEWMSILYGEWINAQQIEQFERTARSTGDTQATFNRGRQLAKHVLRLDRLLGETGRPRMVLDFGCGDGDFLAMARLFGFEAFGIDFSESRAQRSNHRGVTVVRDFDAFDAIRISKVDAASLFETLEHVREPLRLLADVKARMRPGGVLIVEVPNCENISAPSTLRQFHAVQPLEHINAFTPASLTRICVRAGFTPIGKPPAHVTTNLRDLLQTEASRFVRPRSTSQYFHT